MYLTSIILGFRLRKFHNLLHSQDIICLKLLDLNFVNCKIFLKDKHCTIDSSWYHKNLNLDVFTLFYHRFNLSSLRNNELWISFLFLTLWTPFTLMPHILLLTLIFFYLIYHAVEFWWFILEPVVIHATFFIFIILYLLYFPFFSVLSVCDITSLISLFIYYLSWLKKTVRQSKRSIFYHSSIFYY